MKEQVYRQCQRNPTSRLLQISHKLKNDNDVTVCWNDVIVNFFSCSFVSLVKFSYWSMFHVNIITGSSFLLQGLDQKSGNRKYARLSFSQYLETGQVRDTKLGTNVSNEMLLNAAKYQGYSFYCSWAIKGESTGTRVGGEGGEITLPTKIRVKFMFFQMTKFDS